MYSALSWLRRFARSEEGSVLLITLLVVLTIGFLGSSLALRAFNESQASLREGDMLLVDHYAQVLMTEMKEFIHYSPDLLDEQDAALGLIGNDDGTVNMLDQYFIFRGRQQPLNRLRDRAPAIRERLRLPTGIDTHFFRVAPYPLGLLSDENYRYASGDPTVPYLYTAEEFGRFRNVHGGDALVELEAFIFPENPDLSFEFRFNNVRHSGKLGSLTDGEVDLTLFVNDAPYQFRKDPTTSDIWSNPTARFTSVGDRIFGLRATMDLPTTGPGAVSPATTGFFVIEYRHSLNNTDNEGNVIFSDWQELEFNLGGTPTSLMQLDFVASRGEWAWTLNPSGDSVQDSLTKAVRSAEAAAFSVVFPEELEGELSVYDEDAYTFVVRAKAQNSVKTFETRVNRFAFDNYAFFIDGEDNVGENLNFAPYTNIFGKIYTGGSLQPTRTTRFFDDVSINGGLSLFFPGGTVSAPTEEQMNRIFLRTYRSGVPAPSFDTVYEFDYIRDVICDPSGIYGGLRWPTATFGQTIDFSLFDYADNSYDGRSLPDNFNGVIFADSVASSSNGTKIRVKGHLHGGKGITIYSESDIEIVSHVTKGFGGDDSVENVGGTRRNIFPYDPTSPRPQNILKRENADIHPISIGLVSDGNIVISRSAPKILRIEAGMYTNRGRVFHGDLDRAASENIAYRAIDSSLENVNPPEYQRSINGFSEPFADGNGTHFSISGDPTAPGPLNLRIPNALQTSQILDGTGSPQPGNNSMGRFYRPMHLRMLNDVYNANGTAEAPTSSSETRKGANYKMLVPDDFWLDMDFDGVRDDVIIDSSGNVRGDLYGIWVVSPFAAAPNPGVITTENLIHLPIWQGAASTPDGAGGTVIEPNPDVYGQLRPGSRRIYVDYQPRREDCACLMLDMDNDGTLEPRLDDVQLFSTRQLAGVGYAYDYNELIKAVGPNFADREMEHTLMTSVGVGMANVYNNNYRISYSNSGYNEWCVLPYSFQLQIKGPIISRRSPDFGLYKDNLTLNVNTFVDQNDPNWVNILDRIQSGVPGQDPLLSKHWSFYQRDGNPADKNGTWINVGGRNDLPIYNNSLGAKTRNFIGDLDFGEFPPPFFPRPLKGLEDVAMRETNFQRGIKAKMERFTNSNR